MVLINGGFLLQFLDKMKITYRPMSILVRREQEKYFLRLKSAVNYGTVKSQAGAEVSRFEVSSLKSFFFISQQLTYKLFVHVYLCNIIRRGYNGKYETPKHSIAVGNFGN